jgi:very-short-patch-repair endonuclease
VGRENARDHTRLWHLAGAQHGVLTRRQLLAGGLTSDEIEGRVHAGRLHRLWRGVFAVGRPRLTLRGWWSAAVLACGENALLSHQSAGQLWGILAVKIGNEVERDQPELVHVTVPSGECHRRALIRVHRRRNLRASDSVRHQRIPVTSPARTLLDLAAALSPELLEASINEANSLRLIDPNTLRGELEDMSGEAGAPSLRVALDRHTFSLTDSVLERRFLGLVRQARLPVPETQQHVVGLRVDFLWRRQRLVVETDGLRYHGTPAQQAKDRARDQALVAAGFVVLRFTHAQVQHDGAHVLATLRTVLSES